jgi:hypothetical protein
MSSSSIIRASAPAYPGLMRRLVLVVLAVGVGALLAYRQRTIDRWEHRLRIGDDPSASRE